MGALRIQMTLDENVVFTTYNVPLIGVGVGPSAKVAFTTFRKDGRSLPSTDTSRPGVL